MILFVTLSVIFGNDGIVWKAAALAQGALETTGESLFPLFVDICEAMTTPTFDFTDILRLLTGLSSDM